MVAFGWIPMRRKHLLHHGWEPCKLLGKPCRLVDVCGGRLLRAATCALMGGPLRHFRGKLPLWTCGWIHSCRQGLPQLPSQFLYRVQLERLHLCEIWRLLEALGSGVLYQPCLAPWPPSKSGFLVKLRIPNISRTCGQRSQNTIPLV